MRHKYSILFSGTVYTVHHHQLGEREREAVSLLLSEEERIAAEHFKACFLCIFLPFFCCCRGFGFFVREEGVCIIIIIVKENRRNWGVFRMFFSLLSLQTTTTTTTRACGKSQLLPELFFFSLFTVVSSFLVVIAAGANGGQAAAPVCLPPPLLEEILPAGATTKESCLCPAAIYHHEEALASDAPILLPRVAELNETSLEKALDLVHSSNGTYIAVLYYATWCPFSRELRPIYNVLSSLFPSIHHVAVEESSVRPSVLSQYGVHSFPIIFVHNRTSRVRYHGSRTLEDFIYFYQNYTGLKSVSGGQSVKRPDCGFAKLVFNVSKSAKEVCPYPWAISPQKWLQDDTYLTLALLFLLIRVLCFLLPIVASAWKQR
jgi:thiol-disulfide isomerase/thioredoxin